MEAQLDEAARLSLGGINLSSLLNTSHNTTERREGNIKSERMPENHSK